MSIDDLWYKNAIIYCLDVEKYQDANGDGVGDFEGLTRRLDYLAGLGVTCVWLQPFYPSPNRDNGYDVSDYYGVHQRHGSLGRLRRLHEPREGARDARHRGPRREPHLDRLPLVPVGACRPALVLSRLVRLGRGRAPAQPPGGHRLSGTAEDDLDVRPQAREYYFHRFYEHQADLNTWNPWVRAEIQKIMGFWLQLGVSGFRMDACRSSSRRRAPNVEHAAGLQPAEGDARLPAVAHGRRHPARRGERPAGREPAVLRATRASGCR
jgi:maltose alpha-D-glucosyltransferase / alpha-amylase